MLAAAVAIILLGLGCIILAAVAWLIWRSRQQALKQKAGQEAGKDMKNLIYQSAYTLGSSASATARSARSIVECREMAFVVTDIEGSTQLSVAGRTVYDQLLAIHDQLMREGIAKFNGTQIVTEGDSFLVAFHSVANAVAFCMDLQFKLLDTPWPRAVLRLPGCEPVTNADGELIIQGPRVRMGVHWALPGLVACRPHALTKAPMIVGIAVSIAQEISDSAHGGQILLSQEAWNKLRGQMPRAGFPIVRRLGLFQLQADEGKPSWLYVVDGSLLRPVRREMPLPRKLVQMWPPSGAAMASDWGLYVTDPPVPLKGRSEELTFVSLRLRLPMGKRSRRRRHAAHQNEGAGAEHQVPSSVLLVMQQLFVKQAQQFEGYMFGSDALTDRRGYFSFAFATPGNALRFCHTVQVCLMYNRWPDPALEYFGATVIGIDGRLVFKGPRVAASVHCGSNYDITPMASYHPTAASGADYQGPAVALSRALANAAHGGQVLMTEEAWHGVQELLQAFPSAMYTINLGLHVVGPEFPRPRYLYEVMPTLLSGRSFKPPNTLQQLELGYREAPSVHEPMTIVFVKVAKPAAVSRAEASPGDLGEEQVVEAIMAYQLGVEKYGGLARSLLPAYGGYECKEPEPGKFTMAFGCLTDAIAWACHIQKDLLKIAWPPALLQMQGCEELVGEHGQRLWRGLRVRVGMACGYINVKKPMNTGRADYFGELANTAARVAALAAPGQILVESSQVEVQMPDGSPLLVEGHPTYLSVNWATSTIRNCATVARGRNKSATEGGAGAGGSTPGCGPSGLATSAWQQRVSGIGAGSGRRVRRASYSAAQTPDFGQLDGQPMAMPFQRVSRACGGCPGAVTSSANPLAVLVTGGSRRRISLLELTSRSLSLGPQNLLALRRKLRAGSGCGGGGGAELVHHLGQQRVENIELRALGRFLLRGLDNPKILYQALPESLLERTYPIATEALISIHDSAVAARTETPSRGSLLALLRRKAGQFGGLMVGGVARGGPFFMGPRPPSRRKARQDAAADSGLGDYGSSAEDTLTLRKATMRHASDVGNAVGSRTLSTLVRAARHHSSIVPHKYPHGLIKPRRQAGLPYSQSIQPEGVIDSEFSCKRMRRSSTSPRHPHGLPALGLQSSEFNWSGQDLRIDSGPEPIREDSASSPQRDAPVAAAAEGHTPRRSPDRSFNAVHLPAGAAAASGRVNIGPGRMRTTQPERQHQRGPKVFLSPQLALRNISVGSHGRDSDATLPSHQPSADGQPFATDPALLGRLRSLAPATTLTISASGTGAALATQPGVLRERSEAVFNSALYSNISTYSSPPPSHQSNAVSGFLGALWRFQRGPHPGTQPSVATGPGVGAELGLGPLAAAGSGGGDARGPWDAGGGGGEGRAGAGRHRLVADGRDGSPGRLPSGLSQLAGGGVRSQRQDSPMREFTRMLSPLGSGDGTALAPAAAAAASDSFTHMRRTDRSLLGPHPLHQQPQQQQHALSAHMLSNVPRTPRVGSAGDGLQLAPPPGVLQRLGSSGLVPLASCREIEPASSSQQPSVTVRLRQRSSLADLVSLGPALSSEGSGASGLPVPEPIFALHPGRPPSPLKLAFLSSLASLAQKPFFRSRHCRASENGEPLSPTSGPLAGPAITTPLGLPAGPSAAAAGGLSLLSPIAGSSITGHQGALSDLRVQAVLRAANAQAGVSEAGSHDVSQSGSLQCAVDSLRRGASLGLTQQGDSSDAGSSRPVSQQLSPLRSTQQRLRSTVWQRLRVTHRLHGRRSSDAGTSAVGLSIGLTDSDPPAGIRLLRSARGICAQRVHSVLVPPIRSATHTVATLPPGPSTVATAQRQSAGACVAPSAASSRTQVGVMAPASMSSPQSSKRGRAERAIAKVLRGVRMVRAVASTGGGAGSAGGQSFATIYSPPGSAPGHPQHEASPGRRSFSSSASSMYSGTASPHVTAGGMDPSTGHGVSGLVANIFGRGAQLRRSTPLQLQALNAGFRRRSAHIVLNEAARLELLQRSTEAVEPCVVGETGDSGETNPRAFAAAVALTYVENRRQQQQQQQLLQSGVAMNATMNTGGDSWDESTNATSLRRFSACDGGSPGNGESFSQGFGAIGFPQRPAHSPPGVAVRVSDRQALLSTHTTLSGGPAPSFAAAGGSSSFPADAPTIAAAAAAAAALAETSRLMHGSASTCGRTNSGTLPSGSMSTSRGLLQPAALGAPSSVRWVQNAGLSHEIGLADMHSVDEMGPVDFGLPFTRDSFGTMAGAGTMPHACQAPLLGQSLTAPGGEPGYSMPDGSLLQLQQTQRRSRSGMHQGLAAGPSGRLGVVPSPHRQHRAGATVSGALDSSGSASVRAGALGCTSRPTLRVPGGDPAYELTGRAQYPTSPNFLQYTAPELQTGTGNLVLTPRSGRHSSRRTLPAMQPSPAAGPQRPSPFSGVGVDSSGISNGLLDSGTLPAASGDRSVRSPQTPNTPFVPGAAGVRPLDVQLHAGAVERLSGVITPTFSTRSGGGGGGQVSSVASGAALGSQQFDLTSPQTSDTLHRLSDTIPHHLDRNNSAQGVDYVNTQAGAISSGAAGPVHPGLSSAGFTSADTTASPALRLVTTLTSPVFRSSTAAGRISQPQPRQPWAPASGTPGKLGVIDPPGLMSSVHSGDTRRSHPVGVSVVRVGMESLGLRGRGALDTGEAGVLGLRQCGSMPRSPGELVPSGGWGPAGGGFRRGPRISEAALPGPSHPLYYNTPMSEWAEPEAVAAVTEAAEAAAGGGAGGALSRRGAGLARRSTRRLVAGQSAAASPPLSTASSGLTPSGSGRRTRPLSAVFPQHVPWAVGNSWTQRLHPHPAQQPQLQLGGELSPMGSDRRQEESAWSPQTTTPMAQESVSSSSPSPAAARSNPGFCTPDQQQPAFTVAQPSQHKARTSPVLSPLDSPKTECEGPASFAQMTDLCSTGASRHPGAGTPSSPQPRSGQTLSSLEDLRSVWRERTRDRTAAASPGGQGPPPAELWPESTACLTAAPTLTMPMQEPSPSLKLPPPMQLQSESASWPSKWVTGPRASDTAAAGADALREREAVDAVATLQSALESVAELVRHTVADLMAQLERCTSPEDAQELARVLHSIRRTQNQQGLEHPQTTYWNPLHEPDARGGLARHGGLPGTTPKTSAGRRPQDEPRHAVSTDGQRPPCLQLDFASQAVSSDGLPSPVSTPGLQPPAAPSPMLPSQVLPSPATQLTTSSPCAVLPTPSEPVNAFERLCATKGSDLLSVAEESESEGPAGGHDLDSWELGLQGSCAVASEPFDGLGGAGDTDATSPLVGDATSQLGAGLEFHDILSSAGHDPKNDSGATVHTLWLMPALGPIRTSLPHKSRRGVGSMPQLPTVSSGSTGAGEDRRHGSGGGASVAHLLPRGRSEQSTAGAPPAFQLERETVFGFLRSSLDANSVALTPTMPSLSSASSSGATPMCALTNNAVGPASATAAFSAAVTAAAAAAVAAAGASNGGAAPATTTAASSATTFVPHCVGPPASNASKGALAANLPSSSTRFVMVRVMELGGSRGSPSGANSVIAVSLGDGLASSPTSVHLAGLEPVGSGRMSLMSRQLSQSAEHTSLVDGSSPGAGNHTFSLMFQCLRGGSDSRLSSSSAMVSGAQLQPGMTNSNRGSDAQPVTDPNFGMDVDARALHSQEPQVILDLGDEATVKAQNASDSGSIEPGVAAGDRLHAAAAAGPGKDDAHNRAGRTAGTSSFRGPLHASGSFNTNPDDDMADGNTDRPSVATVSYSERTSAFSLRSLQSITDRTSANMWMGDRVSANTWTGDRSSTPSQYSHMSSRTDLDAGAQGWRQQQHHLETSRSELGRRGASWTHLPRDLLWSTSTTVDATGAETAKGRGGVTESGMTGGAARGEAWLEGTRSRSLRVYGTRDRWGPSPQMTGPGSDMGGGLEGGHVPRDTTGAGREVQAAGLARPGLRVSSIMAAVAEVELESESPRVRRRSQETGRPREEPTDGSQVMP